MTLRLLPDLLTLGYPESGPPPTSRLAPRIGAASTATLALPPLRPGESLSPEAQAARDWLEHVVAGRIGPEHPDEHYHSSSGTECAGLN